MKLISVVDCIKLLCFSPTPSLDFMETAEKKWKLGFYYGTDMHVFLLNTLSAFMMWKYVRQWQVKVERMMLKEGVMLLLVHFLPTWQGICTLRYLISSIWFAWLSLAKNRKQWVGDLKDGDVHLMISKDGLCLQL